MMRPFLVPTPWQPMPNPLPFSVNDAMVRVRNASTVEEVAENLEQLAQHLRSGLLCVRPSVSECRDSSVAITLSLDLAYSADFPR